MKLIPQFGRRVAKYNTSGKTLSHVRLVVERKKNQFLIYGAQCFFFCFFFSVKLQFVFGSKGVRSVR